MKKIKVTLGIMAALVMVLITAAPGFSTSNAELAERISQLEEKSGAEPGALGKISERVTLSGTIEIEAGFESFDSNGSDSSDISLATAELGIEAVPQDWISGFMLLSWDDDEDELIVDQAHVTLGNTDELPYYLSAGKLYIPFGVFETMMISDPITLDIGEIVDNAIQVGMEINGFQAAAYLYNGEVDEADDDDTISRFGFSLGYALEREEYTLNLGVDWTSNVLESGALSKAVGDAGDLVGYVHGLAAHAMAAFGPVCLIGEYVYVTDNIEIVGKDTIKAPSAFALEAGYTFDVSGFETTLALGYQASRDAAGILPETKYLASVGVGITDNLGLALEYATAEDYSAALGTKDDDLDTLTIQLAFEF
jgi:hypothetical protein